MAYIDKKSNMVVTESPEGKRIVDEIVKKNAFPGATDFNSIMKYLMEQANQRGFSEASYLTRYLNDLRTGVSEEVPIVQDGYSDEYGTYDEYGTMIDYYRGLSPTKNVAEPRGVQPDWMKNQGNAHDAINNEIEKNSLLDHLMKFFR